MEKYEKTPYKIVQNKYINLFITKDYEIQPNFFNKNIHICKFFGLKMFYL